MDLVPGRGQQRARAIPLAHRTLTGQRAAFSETIDHCGAVAHCFTHWPKRNPLPRKRTANGQ
jgi:hypothetical protein